MPPLEVYDAPLRGKLRPLDRSTDRYRRIVAICRVEILEASPKLGDVGEEIVRPFFLGVYTATQALRITRAELDEQVTYQTTGHCRLIEVLAILQAPDLTDASGGDEKARRRGLRAKSRKVKAR